MSQKSYRALEVCGQALAYMGGSGNCAFNASLRGPGGWELPALQSTGEGKVRGIADFLRLHC
jgi:hypothetical protein